MKPRSSADKPTRPRKRPTCGHALPPGLPSLRLWFQKSNLPLTERQYKQLWLFHTLLRQRNAEYDLTRIHQFDNMVQKHYIDCVLAARILGFDLPSPCLDIGTGAGFPGIPLKIVSPQTHLILAEGRHKRIAFLKEALAALGLQGVEIYEGKVYASFGREVAGVITRALESIPSTLGRVGRCLRPGGRAIFMKGPRCDEEVAEALRKFPEQYALLQDIPYAIPLSPHRRRLVVFQRR
jgi:16S rRNA (guanine(527)-N(7))-methyltransferase RsmG